MTTLPDTLPPLAKPEPGFYFHSADEAYERAQQLNANVLTCARVAIEEAYRTVARLRHDALHPLPGMSSTANGPTASVLDDLLRGLIDADGNSTAHALGQIDEAFLWADVPDEREQPLLPWTGSLAPVAFVREGGI